MPDLELSVSATTRQPRAGEIDGRDYHFLSTEQFDQRIDAEDFLEFATYSGNLYGTLRSEVRKRLDQGRSVLLEIEVQGARQVRAAMRESVQVFIAPPDPASLRRRLESRGTDSSRRSMRGSRWPSRRWPPRASSRTPSSTTILSVPPVSWRRSCAPSLDITRLPSRMIKPRVDKLLDHTDSHYAAVVVAAKRARQINSYFHSLGEGSFGEYPPPMVDVPGDRNYLSIALEEVAQGKLKYEYRA